MKPLPGVQIDYGHPLANGLQGLYLLNEGAGIRATELANGKSGTLTNFSGNSVWTGSPYGGAVSFDGSNDYITAGNTMQPQAAFSVACTVNFRSFTSFPVICGKYNENITTGWLINASNAGVVQFLLFGNTTGSIFIGRSASGAPLSLNRWYNIIATWDGGAVSSTNCRIYINGQRQDNTDLAGGVFVSPSASAADFLIGGAFISNNPGAFYMTNGIIDNVRIYNRALNQFEAMQLNINPYEGLHL